MTAASSASTPLNLANYTTIFADNFANDNSLNSANWPVHWGNANDFSFGNGGLTITSYASEGWSSVGFMTADWGGSSGNTYGLYQVTASLTAGQGIGPCICLWPADNVWPGPEIDLLESADPSRGTGWYTIHWKDATTGGNDYSPSSV